MRRFGLVLVGAVLGGLTTIAVGGIMPAEAGKPHQALVAVMSGAEEVPGPGDADGIGVAALLVSPNKGRVCYFVAVRSIGPATAAHIHRGPAGIAGPVVVPLDPPTDRFSAMCTSVDRALARELVETPAEFYVNVHNEEFPGGAVRGQLTD